MNRLLHVVLVHGAFHRAASWSALLSALEARGVPASAVDLPFAGYAADREALRSALDLVRPRRLLLCAHSSAGMLISDPDVGPSDHLVYLGAFMPEEGEDPLTLARSAPPTDLRFECGDDGTCAIPADVARNAFYGDLDDDAAEAAIRLLRPMSTASLLSPPAPHPTWKSVPSTYVVLANDRAFHPDLQRRLATRASRRAELAAGHAPFLSDPETLATVVARIVRG